MADHGKLVKRLRDCAALVGEDMAPGLVSAAREAADALEGTSSETREPEGYPGILHDFETTRTALEELEKAALRMAQCWNRADARGEGVTVAEMNAARQGVDVARAKAREALRTPVSAIAMPSISPEEAGYTSFHSELEVIEAVNRAHKPHEDKNGSPMTDELWKLWKTEPMDRQVGALYEHARRLARDLAAKPRKLCQRCDEVVYPNATASATPMPKWVPISERLPQLPEGGFEDFWVCAVRPHGTFVYALTWMNCPFDKKSGENKGIGCIENGDGDDQDFIGWHEVGPSESYDCYYKPAEDKEIVAWMPMQKPELYVHGEVK